MENSVLGNALEGVPEEEEEEEKPKDSNVESVENVDGEGAGLTTSNPTGSWHQRLTLIHRIVRKVQRRAEGSGVRCHGGEENRLREAERGD